MFPHAIWDSIMQQQDIEKILQSVAAGSMKPDAALERLKTLPFEDLG